MGLDVVRRVADGGPRIPFLDLLLEHAVLAGDSGAIVQVGANDGKMDDPVYKAITRLDLPAILIEPLPDLFDKLKANYAGHPKVRFENCAISPRAGTATIYRVRQDADLAEWIQGLASFDKQVLLSHRTWPGAKGVEDCIETLRVPTLTMAQVLAKHADIGRVLALQIDTEGHDFEVVKSAMEAGLKPRIVAYEYKHLSYADQSLCRALLERNGYGFLSSPPDTIAYRMSETPPVS